MKKILCKGNVQGVGFRMTTLKIATQLSLVGFVKNLPDGDVLIMTKGDEEIIEKLKESLKKIFSCNFFEEKGIDQEFNDFFIKYD